MDRDCRSRCGHIEVIPHNGDPPLFTIPHKDLANCAKGQSARTVRYRFVVLRIAVEAVNYLFTVAELCA